MAENKPETITKEYKLGDLTGAKDVNSALEAYLGLSKNGGSETLQRAMAEKLLGLGDTENSAKFLLLSQETHNLEVMKNVADAMYQSSETNKSATYNFGATIQEFLRGTNSISNSAEQIADASRRMGR